MDPEQMQRVAELRQKGRSPKEVARALGLRPADVMPVICGRRPATEGSTTSSSSPTPLTNRRAESVLTSRRRSCHLAAETAVWSTITQIYEGTNQIQRVVMARQLLKGW